MRSAIIIENGVGGSGAPGYRCSAYGKFGGGYRFAWAGTTPNEAAAFAIRELIRYARPNSEGGDLIAPPEVLDLVPPSMYATATASDQGGGEEDSDSWYLQENAEASTPEPVE